MKVIGFNGSPRKNGNTALLIERVFRGLEAGGIETEYIQLSYKKIHGCISCYGCEQNKDRRCAVSDDSANEYIEKIIQAQGVVLGSPSYFAGVTPEMKALIDRAGFVARNNGMLFRNKVGCMVSVARRVGGVQTLDCMSHFFLSLQMTIVGRAIGIAGDRGEMGRDEEGLRMAEALGQRMGLLLKQIEQPGQGA